MITREEALELIKKYIKKENTIKHMLATEAIMVALAKKLEPEKEDLWAMAGLLHDLDYEVMKTEKEHGVRTLEILKEEGFNLPQEVLQAIMAHCYDFHQQSKPKPKTKMDWSLFICDSLTGLIVACALVQPAKKLSSVKLKSIKKKFKNKAFAAGTRRKDILLCEERLGIPVDEFFQLSLEAMQNIASELGL
jgi:putative nucleotidyltransferase with HDIG domain